MSGAIGQHMRDVAEVQTAAGESIARAVEETRYHAGLALGSVPLPAWLDHRSLFWWKATVRPNEAMGLTFRALRREERSFGMLTDDAPCGYETRRAGVDWLVDNERGVLVMLYRGAT